MQDAKSVITEAAKGLGERIAEFWEVYPSRAYEILGKDNPYPKLRRLVRAIAAVTRGKDRVRRLLIIRADFNAFIDELLDEDKAEQGEVETCILCNELYDVMRTKMAGMPAAERLKECREAIVILQTEVACLEKSRDETSA